MGTAELCSVQRPLYIGTPNPDQYLYGCQPEPDPDYVQTSELPRSK